MTYGDTNFALGIGRGTGTSKKRSYHDRNGKEGDKVYLARIKAETRDVNRFELYI